MVYKRLERILIQLDKVDSTNRYAIDKLRDTEVSSGTVILAQHQHDGRGQRSNRWTTEPSKNLTFSLIFIEEVPVKRTFYLNIAASLAVRKTLEDLSIRAKIKWPNDILVEGKKIAGILVENQIQGDKTHSSVIGIGLNVNQDQFQGFEATSILIEKGQKIELEDVFDQLYSYLDFYLNLLCEQNYDLMLKHYYNHLYLKDEPARFKDASGEFNGKIQGINDLGLLRVQRENEIITYDIKEISYL